MNPFWLTLDRVYAAAKGARVRVDFEVCGTLAALEMTPGHARVFAKVLTDLAAKAESDAPCAACGQHARAPIVASEQMLVVGAVARRDGDA